MIAIYDSASPDSGDWHQQPFYNGKVFNIIGTLFHFANY